MATPSWVKDPDATLDYGFDWSDWLEVGETIDSSSWTVPSGLTNVAEVNTTTQTKVWLSGGTAGTEYTVTNRVVTTGGSRARTDDRSFVLRVENR